MNITRHLTCQPTHRRYAPNSSSYPSCNFWGRKANRLYLKIRLVPRGKLSYKKTSPAIAVQENNRCLFW